MYDIFIYHTCLYINLRLLTFKSLCIKLLFYFSCIFVIQLTYIPKIFDFSNIFIIILDLYDPSRRI